MSQLQQCFPDILKPAPGLSPAAAYHEATEKVFRAARALDKANEGVVRHQGLLKEATEKAVQAQVPKWEADKAAETARVAYRGVVVLDADHVSAKEIPSATSIVEGIPGLSNLKGVGGQQGEQLEAAFKSLQHLLSQLSSIGAAAIEFEAEQSKSGESEKDAPMEVGEATLSKEDPTGADLLAKGPIEPGDHGKGVVQAKVEEAGVSAARSFAAVVSEDTDYSAAHLAS